jgi:hypothetical protein
MKTTLSRAVTSALLRLADKVEGRETWAAPTQPTR